MMGDKKTTAKKSDAKAAEKRTGTKTSGKKRDATATGGVPLGIGSHHTLVDDQATFGDFEFERTDVGGYTITFADVGCREKEWPPPVMFTNVSGDRSVGIQGWDCKDGNFIVYVTSEEGGVMADFDFDWMVYR